MSVWVFFSLFLIKYIFSYPDSKYRWTFQSLNQEDNSLYDKLSSQAKRIIKKLLEDNKNFLGTPYVTYLNTVLISADKDKSIKIDLPYENGDIGTDVMELLYIKKKGDYFAVKKYNIDYYLNSSSVINSLTNPEYNSSFYEVDDEESRYQYEIACFYELSDNKFESIDYISNNIYKKFVRIGFLTFKLDKKKGNVYSLSYSNKGLNIQEVFSKEINTSLLKSSVIEDLFVIEQSFHILEGFLIFRTKDNLLLVYKITPIPSTKNFNLVLFDNIDLNILKIERNDKIYKLGILKENVYLVSSENHKMVKLIGYENKTKWMLNQINSLKEYTIIDFVVCEKTLYAIAKNTGLLVLKMKEGFVLRNFLSYTSFSQIDFYYNPFYGNKFIGLGIDQSKNGTEVFLELMINDESRPKINKVIYSSERRKLSSFYNVDSFFSFFLDIESKEILLIRRGLLNSVPFVTYRVNLKSALKDYENNAELFITSVYDNKTDNHIPVIVSSDKYIIINNLTLATHQLNCTFFSEGSFNLTFVQRGEVCATSLEKSIEDPYATCQKIVSYSFHIYSTHHNSVWYSLLISISFVIFIISVFFCVISCRSEDIKLEKVDKDELKKIYGEEEKEDKKNK